MPFPCQVPAEPVHGKIPDLIRQGLPADELPDSARVQAFSSCLHGHYTTASAILLLSDKFCMGFRTL